MWDESYESKTIHFECGGETVLTPCPVTKVLRRHLHRTEIFSDFRLKILKREYLRIKDKDKIRPRICRRKKDNSPHNLHLNLSAGTVLTPLPSRRDTTPVYYDAALWRNVNCLNVSREKGDIFETFCSGFAAPSNKPAWTLPINTLEA